jgi:hypothetical protein
LHWMPSNGCERSWKGDSRRIGRRDDRGGWNAVAGRSPSLGCTAAPPQKHNVLESTSSRQNTTLSPQSTTTPFVEGLLELSPVIRSIQSTYAVWQHAPTTEKKNREFTPSNSANSPAPDRSSGRSKPGPPAVTHPPPPPLQAEEYAPQSPTPAPQWSWIHSVPAAAPP